MRFVAPAMLALATLALTACATSPTVGDWKLPATSFDGLVPYPATVMDRVWVREGIGLGDYRKVLLESAQIQFRPLTRPMPGGLSSPVTPFPLDARAQAEIRELIEDAFADALDRLTLTRVSEPGPDVLRVRGTLLDVVVAPTDGDDAYRIDSVGQLTFAVELVDSQTGTVLLRAVDTRAARTPGTGADDVPGTEGAPEKVPTLIARWAELLVNALNDLTALDQLRGTATEGSDT